MENESSTYYAFSRSASGHFGAAQEDARLYAAQNFVQSVFNAVRADIAGDFRQTTLVVGGDGRYYNRTAIQTILRIAAANGFGRVMVGRGGILSTPAMSAVIRRRGALGGLVLSASHNPGGIDEDFGIKYNISNGGPAPEVVTERIYGQTLAIKEYATTDHPEADLDRKGSFSMGETEVVIFDPLADYTAVMEELFDFEALRGLFRSGFRMLFDAMHAVTGPYAHQILERHLGAPQAQSSMARRWRISAAIIPIPIWCMRPSWWRALRRMTPLTSARPATATATAT